MSQLITFVAERAALGIPRGSVDRRNNLVRNVRVVGPRSRNKRKYPGEVTARHVQMYAAPVNIGHHYDAAGRPVEVSPEHKFGAIISPRAHADGVNGDLKYNPKHKFAEPFLWACEHEPGMYAFSALKKVRWKAGPDGAPLRDADGDMVAESILMVASVDIVQEGGATSSIFESWHRESAGMFPTDPKALAGQFQSAGAVAGFLSDFLAALPFGASELELVRSVLANWTPGEGGSGSGTTPELQSALDATSGAADAAESMRRIRALVNDCPFVSEQRSARGGQSVADLVAGYTG